MLSYMHSFHAGNFADCAKHIALCTILNSLNKKDKPYTVIDTHSGEGRYKTDDERLLKTGEAKDGILKLFKLYGDVNIPFPEEVRTYMEAELNYLEKNEYAGSAELERYFMRPSDTLFLIDKHPQVQENLKANMALPLRKENNATKAIKPNILNKDSYEALKALTPPLVKRGLILCDPSYEDAEDYVKVTKALTLAHQKWNTGIIALWYPLIARRKNETAQMLAALENAAKMGTNPCECFKIELEVKEKEELEGESHLYGTGIFIINPPWLLEEQLTKANAFLKKLYEIF